MQGCARVACVLLNCLASFDFPRVASYTTTAFEIYSMHPHEDARCVRFVPFKLAQLATSRGEVDSLRPLVATGMMNAYRARDGTYVS